MQCSKSLSNSHRSWMLLMAAFALSGCLGSESDDAPTTIPNPPPDNAPPAISGSPATAVIIGNTYSFTPSASDADNDPLTFSIENSPAWVSFNANTGELSGQPMLGDIGLYSDILISVTDGQATASLPRYSISVDQVGNLSVTLNWTPPTQNEDGTALVDLAGYTIYWGTTPGNYPNSATIDNASISTYVVGNLAPGTYEFVATSFNTSGVESVLSNSTTKVLP